jgi:hypothetical protein
MRRGGETAGDRLFRRAVAAVSLVACVLVGAASGGAGGAALGALLGLALAAGAARLTRRRAERIGRLLHAPFPSAWRELLERLDSYARLPPELRRRFEDDVRIFVSEKRITGVGVELDDELRLLVAASAATVGLGWPDFDWQPLSEVLLYPDDFARDYGRATGDDDDRAGEAHAWGTVILSVPALIESWEEPGDGFHVGYHELAHLLDVEQTEFDGIPIGLDSEGQRRWVELREREMRRLRRGRSVLDPYGAEDPVEFLPVAVEAFFDCPRALRRRHRELYEQLAGWLCQDPAGWEDAASGGSPAPRPAGRRR